LSYLLTAFYLMITWLINAVDFRKTWSVVCAVIDARCVSTENHVISTESTLTWSNSCQSRTRMLMQPVPMMTEVPLTSCHVVYVTSWTSILYGDEYLVIQTDEQHCLRILIQVLFVVAAVWEFQPAARRHGDSRWRIHRCIYWCMSRRLTCLLSVKQWIITDKNILVNVTVELLLKKCLPTLLYAREVWQLNKSDIRALDYVVDSALKKIFDTNSKEIILECRLMFDLNSIGDVLLKRQRTFLLAYWDLDNNLICRSIAALSANWLACRPIALR